MRSILKLINQKNRKTKLGVLHIWKSTLYARIYDCQAAEQWWSLIKKFKKSRKGMLGKLTWLSFIVVLIVCWTSSDKVTILRYIIVVYILTNLIRLKRFTCSNMFSKVDWKQQIEMFFLKNIWQSKQPIKWIGALLLTFRK